MESLPANGGSEDRGRPAATIVIPAYDEEEAIGATLEELSRAGIPERYEVLVVDDGSTDRTAEIVAGYPWARLVRHGRNRGYGAALKTGVRRARAEKVVFMDADGQHEPQGIDEIVGLLDGHVIAIGERGASSREAPTRLVGKKLVRWVAEYLLRVRLPDFNSGFRGFRRGYIRSILGILPNGFSFSTTSTLAAIQQGYEYATVPIRARERRGRPSTVRFFRDGGKTALLILRIVMMFNPLRIFVPASALLTAIAIFWAGYGISVARRIPNSAVLVGVLGMLLFFIGLLADQISLVHLGREPEEDGMPAEARDPPAGAGRLAGGAGES